MILPSLVSRYGDQTPRGLRGMQTTRLVAMTTHRRANTGT
jgi:hypothetical protein